VTREEFGFVLPVDKPVGPTSHDVVREARKALRERRVGHTGTLDPFASGLLLLCVGRATRLSEYLTGLDKEYLATARLGETTSTDDREGEILEKRDGWEVLSGSDLEQALEIFLGETQQVPPQFSAKKVRGEAMYRKARRGEHVALDPVSVVVYEITVEAVVLPDVRFRVRCSSGTYVRALARDLGEHLQVGAHLTELRRVAVGHFRVEQAITMAQMSDVEAVAGARIDPLRSLAHLPDLEVDDEAARKLSFGQPVPYDGPDVTGPVAVHAGSALVAVGHPQGGQLKPSKVFV
jgi:tRNA pseudouridine55 synthase